MIEAEIVEAGKSVWQKTLVLMSFFIMIAWAGATLIMQGTRFKRWALKTILTPIILLCCGIMGLIAARAGNAEFWLFLLIVLLSSAFLVKHMIRIKRQKEDLLASVPAKQHRGPTARTK